MARNTMVRPFSVGPALLHAMPKIKLLDRIAGAYRNWYSGENNVWADTNGEFWVLEKLMPQCSRVFDVGANVGDWTRQCLVNNSELEIHCFEAASDNYAAMRRLGFGKNIVQNNVAVSNTNGSIELNLFGTNSPFNSIIAASDASSGEPTAKETVEAVTLEQYVKSRQISNVDYVKIDVEGAERLVLAGMGTLLDNGLIDAIQLEHGRYSIFSRTLILDYFEILTRRNFAMYKIVQHGLQYYPKYSSDIESFNHQNWLCVREGSKLHQLSKSLLA